MTTQSTQDKLTAARAELTAARAALTPTVVAALRLLADNAAALADHLEAVPGDGIGLSYARVYSAWDVVESAMTRYQNNPVPA